jgi:uncharacterized membrane protein YcaP (DUF421 family)
MTLHELTELFRFGVGPVEMIVRGSAVYWFLFLLFRFVLRRDAGSIGIADILLLVLIADAAQNAMAGDYHTLADGFVLVTTIAGWNWLIDYLGFRFPRLRKWVEPRPVVLVRHGHLQPAAMRRQMVTTEELLSRLREHGIDKLADVKFARMETDGDISVIRTAPDPGDDDGPAAGGGRPGAGAG